MRKSILVILLIFVIPAVLYYSLQKEKVTTLPSYATTNKPAILKFYSPMCSECQELEKIMDDVYPAYSGKVDLNNINVTVNNKENKRLIKENNVTLVPTTVFKFADGNVSRRIEGSMQQKILENYIREILSE